MKYRVVPSVWPVAGRVFRHGDIVNDDQLGRNTGSFLRLGLIETVEGTKKELVAQATAAGLTIPKSATKAQIAELLEEHHGV